MSTPNPMPGGPQPEQLHPQPGQQRPPAGQQSVTPAATLASSKKKVYWPVAGALGLVVVLNIFRLAHDGTSALAFIIAMVVLVAIGAPITFVLLRQRRGAVSALQAEGITWSVTAAIPADFLKAAGSWNAERCPSQPINGLFGCDEQRVVWVPTTSLKKASRLTFRLDEVGEVAQVTTPIQARVFPTLVFLVGPQKQPVPVIVLTTPAKLLAKLALAPAALAQRLGVIPGQPQS